ncbi:hypothetical protein [Kosakonia sacchari]|uniref:hypothetical protein n=1 Tax=Kosakonia sacchari TaxID=1158459 RepID=UPI0015848990|nr:hypothetical protein [Kosakonia sacchari]NUL35069.1 hypothetical protein [Kosakonia sacchari]
MEPVIPAPAELAETRYTSKTRLQRNIDMVDGLKSSHASISAAIEYLKTGLSLANATGKLIDAWGERYGIPREGRGDDEYKAAIVAERGGSSTSLQSRPAIGAYLHQKYKFQWMRPGQIADRLGAVGAAFNRVPLRMVFAQFGGTAPDITLPGSLVSATFEGDVYSAATPPNIRMVNHAPMFPGNAFKAVWGGLVYQKTQQTIAADSALAIAAVPGKSLYTGFIGSSTILDPDPIFIEPYNTLPTVTQMKVSE